MQTERRTSNVQCSTSNGAGRATREAFDLEERLLEFATRICRLCETLPRTRAANHAARQLLRSGKSPLPNHGEAQAAESREDFVHKMRVCLKELRETKRWLLLAQRVPPTPSPASLDPLLQETEQLIRIFVASIRTASNAERP
jgi:four helix bundle protein